MTKSSASSSTDPSSTLLNHDPIVQKIESSELYLEQFANQHDINWTVLRPTLIYDIGKDKNISSIMKFLKRFKFFPLIGDAKGLRQPLHAEDIAVACLATLNNLNCYNRAYNISGGETLNYKKMVERLFWHLSQKPRFIKIPVPLMQSFLKTLSKTTKYRDLTPEMALRMNQDLVFSNEDALRDFGFNPRKFLSNYDNPCR